MNREEAVKELLELYVNSDNGFADQKSVSKLINGIYDNFEGQLLNLEEANTDLQVKIIHLENKTCKTCKYRVEDACKNIKLNDLLDEYGEMDNFLHIEDTFGCNKWEMKI
jgi:hypothetical protein